MNKPGLYANILAKQERIKRGSGERMRKPGSKGAPTAADFKAAAKTAAKKTVVAKVAKTSKVKTAKSATPREDEFDVPTLDADLSVSEITDTEMADLRHQLGL